MRILLLMQSFDAQPDQLKGIRFVKALQQLGHHVDVLTDVPEGSQSRTLVYESRDGVPVYRVAHATPSQQSGISRALDGALFALSASGMMVSRIPRPDLIYVVHGPTTLALFAWLLRLLDHVPYVYDIQDIRSWQRAGRYDLPLLHHLASYWCHVVYRRAGAVIVPSHAVKGAVAQCGVPEQRIAVVYPWCDEHLSVCPSPDPALGEVYGLAGHFNVIFTGPIKASQGLDAVLLAAQALRDEIPEVQFVFIGDGPELNRLIDVATTHDLTNVRFIARQPRERITRFLPWADALLVHLRNEQPLHAIPPRRLLSAFAAGRPIIAGMLGESIDLVERAGCGLTIPPESAVQLADAVRHLYQLPSEQRRAMGERGRKFYQNTLSATNGINAIDAVCRATLHAAAPFRFHMEDQQFPY